jgi:dihydroxynaphthoic acid synthetase
MYEDILYEKKDGIARITINRPKVYNAFRDQTIDEMIDAFEDANGDESVGVIVLSGAGGKAFCTGGDVKWEGEFNPAGGRALFRRIMKLSHAMRNNGKPVIAAVRGYCIGGGNELNLLCDLTIATENSKFGQAGPKMGSVPVWYGTQMLPRVLGEKRAREMVYLCHQYTAREALQMGLVNKVVPDDQLEEAVGKWCRELLEKSPQALRIAKISMNFESDMLYPSVVHGFNMISMAHGTEEFQEGCRAFTEKRKPDFNQFRK